MGHFTKRRLFAIVAAIGLCVPAAMAVDNPTATVWVDKTGDSAARLHIANTYHTFAEAMAAVPEGGTIKVLPGVYREEASLAKSVKFIAVNARGQEVNPDADPRNTDWPVIIEGTGTEGIKSSGMNNEHVIIRGFFIRDIGPNGVGIQVWGHQEIDRATKYNINQHLCHFIEIAGNKVDNVAMDGIKIHQCSDVNVHGNIVSNFGQAPSGIKQGIDFVGVANSRVADNIVLTGGVGMDLKAGTSNILVENNDFLGPFKWVAFGAEPAGDNNTLWHSHHNDHPYQLRNVVMRKNRFISSNTSGDVFFSGCQNCSFVDNMVRTAVLIADFRDKKSEAAPEENMNICVENNVLASADGEKTGSPALLVNKTDIAVSISGCTRSLDAWPRAAEVQSPGGLDLYAPN